METKLIPVMSGEVVQRQYALLNQNIADDDEIPQQAKNILFVGLGLLEDIHLKITKISEK